MGYTHYFKVNRIKRNAKQDELSYVKAIEDCQRIVRRFYAENGGLSGYTAHCPIGAYGGLNVNGKGDDGHETFILREHFNQNEAFSFCKTARKPYDLVVVACLAALKHRMGDAIEVSSDGNANEWQDGVDYARKVTGLKIKNPLGMVKTKRLAKAS